MTSKRVLIAALILLILVVTPAAAQGVQQRFNWIVAKKITVQTGGVAVTAGGVQVTAGDVAVTAGVTAADVTASDDISVGDDLTVAGEAIYTAPARTVIANQATLAPVTANVPISSTGAVGLTSITCGAGKIYHVVNVGAQNILITDTSTMKLTANFTLGALDNITLLGDGTNCIELARANN